VRRTLATSSGSDFDTMPSINITPLIDVLLVLIVVMMLSLPMGQNKIPIDLPTPGTTKSVPPVTHRLTIAQNGAYSWDGASIDEATLTARLRAHARDTQQPLLLVRIDDQTHYDRAAQTISTIKKAGVTALAFEGMAKWKSW
jgi:biopolymer transport protein ExbD